MKHPHEMTDQDRIHDLEETVSRLEAERQPLIREVAALARESVKRDGALAKLEAEVIASRDIVRKAVTRAEELERLVRDYRAARQAVDEAEPEVAAYRVDAEMDARKALFAAVAEKDGEL